MESRGLSLMNEFLEIDGVVGNDHPREEMTSGHWSKRAWPFRESRNTPYLT